MKAGPRQLLQPKSISPLEIEKPEDEIVAESDADDEGGVVEAGDQVERLALGKEGAVVRKLVDPKLPSEKEVEEHYVRGHFPYRNWCHICVKAKGKDMGHQKEGGKERKVPEYHFDYCFPGDELGFKWTILVGKERISKTWMATAVPNKGASGRFGTDKCLEFSEENGDGDNNVIVKKDQEPSMEYLFKDIRDQRPEGRTIPEESPVKSSGSNGIVERGVQEIEGGIRALLLGLQERLGRKIDARERIVSFIPEYVAYLLNRLSQGEDGKVPYERIRGKKPTILGLEFGEKLLYKVKRGSKLEKINERWEHGIFLGVRRKSNELWIGTKDGIESVRSVKRIPVEQRWGEDCVNWIRWAPWRRYKDAVEADGDLPEGVPAEEIIEAKNNRGTVIIETKARAPREFYISKKDIEK